MSGIAFPIVFQHKLSNKDVKKLFADMNNAAKIVVAKSKGDKAKI
ncbi:hypothetical protein [Butyrivibrio sp.]|nr:hypothetical protein [Butyrivibrio sp.]